MNRRKLLTLLSVSPLGLLIQNSKPSEPISTLSRSLESNRKVSLVCIYGAGMPTSKSGKKSSDPKSIKELIFGEIYWMNSKDKFCQWQCNDEVKKSVKYYLFYGDVPRKVWTNPSGLKEFCPITYDMLLNMSEDEDFHLYYDLYMNNIK